MVRLLDLLRRLPAWLSRNGGYWGGVFLRALVMADPRNWLRRK